MDKSSANPLAPRDQLTLFDAFFKTNTSMKSGLFVLFLLVSFLGVSLPGLPDFTPSDAIALDFSDVHPESDEEDQAVETEEVETEVIPGESFRRIILSVKSYSYCINFKDLIPTYLTSIFIPPIA